MPKAKLQAAALGGSADAIETAFYDALRAGDLDRLMACWADEDEMVCVHPGSGRLVGVLAIRAGFEALLSQGGVAVQATQICKIESLTSAVHSVIEVLQIMTPQGARQAHVVATNVYHRTAQGWRIVAHHASPGTPAADAVAAPPPTPSQTLH